MRAVAVSLEGSIVSSQALAGDERIDAALQLLLLELEHIQPNVVVSAYPLLLKECRLRRLDDLPMHLQGSHYCRVLRVHLHFGGGGRCLHWGTAGCEGRVSGDGLGEAGI